MILYIIETTEVDQSLLESVDVPWIEYIMYSLLIKGGFYIHE